MKFSINASRLAGSVDIPGSKSHTIRGVLLAALATGESTLDAPLRSADTEAAVRVYSKLGATFDRNADRWIINGIGADLRAPAEELDVGNSGTTLRVAMGSLALLHTGTAVITGDRQIRSRPSQPLADALNDLGAEVVACEGNGCAPFRVRGPLQGGRTSITCHTSQYLTSLLLACPFAEHDSHLDVPLLNEKAYVGITLDWLRHVGIQVSHDKSWSRFTVPGGQTLTGFQRRVPADWSTATFFLCAAALGENAVSCRGLDRNDSQSDKAVLNHLQALGADIDVDGDVLRVHPRPLTGCELDLNDTPDALPMMAVMGCFAKGETRLVNVPQARIKETDRIAVMCRELRKLGADVEELADGLIIRESELQGTLVNGHHDHRVVMSLAVAGTQIPGTTTITTAEAAAVTVPQFTQIMQNLGADLAAAP